MPPFFPWVMLIWHIESETKWPPFPDDIFKWIFLNENVWILINIPLKFVPRGPINNIPTLVQVMAWRRSGNKPLCEPMMVRLPTHIYASLGLNELSGFASDHRVALVVHRNLYPVRPVSGPHFRLGRWRAALEPLMLTVPIALSCSNHTNVRLSQIDIYTRLLV